MKKPPLGIPPRFIIDEFRRECRSPIHLLSFDFARWMELKKVIKRYDNAGLLLKREWIEEDIDIEFKLYHWGNRN